MIQKVSPIVSAAHTVVEPSAVVIETGHTLITGAAVFGFRSSENNNRGNTKVNFLQ